MAHDLGNKIIDTTGLFVSSSTGLTTGSSRFTTLAVQLRPALEGLEIHGQQWADEYGRSSDGQQNVGACGITNPIRFHFRLATTSGNDQRHWMDRISLQTSSTSKEIRLTTVQIQTGYCPCYLFSYRPPQHTAFPGDVPLNAARVNKTVMAAPAGLINLVMQEHVPTDGWALDCTLLLVKSSTSRCRRILWAREGILVSAHTDKLWNKDTLSRHPVIFALLKQTAFNSRSEMPLAVQSMFTNIPAVQHLVSLTSLRTLFSPHIGSKAKSCKFVSMEQHQGHHPAPWAEIGGPSHFERPFKWCTVFRTLSLL